MEVKLKKGEKIVQICPASTGMFYVLTNKGRILWMYATYSEKPYSLDEVLTTQEE